MDHQSKIVCPNNGWINIYRGIYNYGMRLYINNILVSTAWLYWDCAYKIKSSSLNCFLFYTHNPI